VNGKRSEALRHVAVEALEDPLREVLELFRQGEGVVFLKNGLPVGILMFLSAWRPPGPAGTGGDLLSGEETS
jgi:hypothetical protein